MSLLDTLAAEIYTNYLAFLSKGNMVNACEAAIEGKLYRACNFSNANVAVIEAKGVRYINTSFILKVYEKIGKMLANDFDKLPPTGTEKPHSVYIAVFIYFSLASERYLNDFAKLHNKKAPKK